MVVPVQMYSLLSPKSALSPENTTTVPLFSWKSPEGDDIVAHEEISPVSTASPVDRVFPDVVVSSDESRFWITCAA